MRRDGVNTLSWMKRIVFFVFQFLHRNPLFFLELERFHTKMQVMSRFHFLGFVALAGAFSVAAAAPWQPRRLSDAQYRQRGSRKADEPYKKGDMTYVAQECYAFSSRQLAVRYHKADADGIRPVRVYSYLGSVGGAGGNSEWKSEVVKDAGKSAVKLEPGDRVRVRACSDRVVRFSRKKKELYVSANDLMSEGEWQARQDAEAEKKAEVQRLLQVLEGEPAMVGKAVVRRLSCACYTQLMLKEYNQIASADTETALAWILQHTATAELLEPGEKVVLMEVDEERNVAKVTTKKGRTWFCNYSVLIAPPKE